MNDDWTKSAEPENAAGQLSKELEVFIQRCIDLGMTSVSEVAEVIPDELVAQRLIAANNHDPLRGERHSVESLVREMKAIAALMLEKEAGRTE